MEQKESSPKDSSQTKSDSKPSEIVKIMSLVALLIAGGFAASYLLDDTKGLPHMDAYKEEYNSDLRLTTVCVKGYRYIIYDSAPRYAVQIWENGPRLSQCPRTQGR